MTPIEQEVRRRWLPVPAGGLIMGAALGIRHVQGLFLAPVSLDHGWSREAFSLALALQNLIWGVAQPFTGMVADRLLAARDRRRDAAVCGRASSRWRMRRRPACSRSAPPDRHRAVGQRSRRSMAR